MSIGLLKQAIYEMKLLSSELDVDLLNKCQMLYSSWLLETGETFEDFKEAYEHIKTMPTVSNCQQLSHWRNEAFKQKNFEFHIIVHAECSC